MNILLMIITLPDICAFIPANDYAACNPPAIEMMPIFLSYYDPKLCLPEHGSIMINCNSDPTKMAGGTPVTDEMYGYAAACPPEWFDKHLMLDYVGERHCLDTGSAIKPTYRRVYTKEGFAWMWVVVVDILSHYENPPDWQYELIYNWSLN